MTNNQAEYEALIEGLKLVIEWKPDRVLIYLDSKLVVEQIKGNWKIKEPDLQRLNSEAMLLLRELDFEISHVPREQNSGADHLANMAIDEKMPRKGKFGG